MLASFTNRARRWLWGRDFAVWYDPAYRLPFTNLEARTGFAPRRADHALWYLLEARVVSEEDLRAPRKVEYAELMRVHTPELLDSLGHAETLARIWAVDSSDVPVAEVMRSVRLACGATLEAAREVLSPHPRQVGRRALNLFGGFHHAGPSVAGGFCPVNDIAVAVAAVRAEGFRGRVLVLDLDAHPPDGTAACLRDDPSVFIGSLSGSDFGPLEGVDETVLPEGTGDAGYLRALDRLLYRMPHGELAFVVAGGDVLEGDPFGRLALTPEGCRERDLRVADALSRVPSVWLPAGGYSNRAWRVLAGTGLALGVRSRAPIPAGYDPLVSRFSAIARSLATDRLSPLESGDDELARDLGLTPPERALFLEFYTAEGIEHALERYGLLSALRRLGYGPFEVKIDTPGVGQRARLVDAPSRETLIEVVLEKKLLDGAPVLYVHWMALRHPRARFSAERPRLPGQEVPGLGLAREVMELLVRITKRLGLSGLAFRPAAYHLAVGSRAFLQFVEPARQGRFEALMRDLSALSLLDATTAVASGRVRMNGSPYAWEPDEMVHWLTTKEPRRAEIDAELARVRFAVAPP